MKTRDSVLFLSHHIKHPRNKYILEFLSKTGRASVPVFSHASSSTLSLSIDSATSMLNLGLAGFQWNGPIYLDGIDVFIHSFIRNRPYLHDYHVPLVPELMWNRLDPLAKAAQFLLPESLSRAKVVISPNGIMLAHAGKYARLPESFIIPNYPPKSFFRDIPTHSAREKLKLSDDREIAVFIGGVRLREVYGIELLLNTWLEIQKKKPDAKLYILGPYTQLDYDRTMVSKLEDKGITFVGRVDHHEVPIWISAADLCLSQRTPGFPRCFYNIQDSLKLSEYALFRKPIVAAGYLEGTDYISTETTVESYKRGILDCLNGNAPIPKPHTWEENLPKLKEAYDILLSYCKAS